MAKKEADRAEASALLERRMAAMEAVLAARRTAIKPPAEPAAARGPGADLRFSVRAAPQAAPTRAAGVHTTALDRVSCLVIGREQ